MDPFTVSSGCVGLLVGITKLSAQITAFVSAVRDAKRDMDAVSRELSSLSLCLSTLRDDSAQLDYPEGLHDNLVAVLKNCDSVVKEMTVLLEKLSSAHILKKVQWSIIGKDDMNKLRSSLESHKSALDIALDMTALLLMSAVKADVADIKTDTAAIKADTSQIPSIKEDTSQIASLVQEIGFLRIQLNKASVHDAKAQQMQRFLDQSTSYAETVIDAIEQDKIRDDSSDDAAVDNDVEKTADVQPSEHDSIKDEESLDHIAAVIDRVTSQEVSEDIQRLQPQPSSSRPRSPSSRTDTATPRISSDGEKLEAPEGVKGIQRKPKLFGRRGLGTQKDLSMANNQDKGNRSQESETGSDSRGKDQHDQPPKRRFDFLGPFRSCKDDEYSDHDEDEKGQEDQIQSGSKQEHAMPRTVDLISKPDGVLTGTGQIQGRPNKQRDLVKVTEVRDEYISVLMDEKLVKEAGILRSRLTPRKRLALDRKLGEAVAGTYRMLVWKNLRLGPNIRSISEIQGLVEDGADPNYLVDIFRSPQGYVLREVRNFSILEVELSYSRRYDVCTLLLKYGARIDQKAAAKLLYLAIEKEDQDMVNLVLKSKMSPSCGTFLRYTYRDEGKEANSKILPMLLECGAKADGEAVWEAAKFGEGHLLELLLVPGGPTKEDKAFALRVAASWNHLSVVTLLLEHGATVHEDDTKWYRTWGIGENQAEIRKLLKRYFKAQKAVKVEEREITNNENDDRDEGFPIMKTIETVSLAESKPTSLNSFS